MSLTFLLLLTAGLRAQEAPGLRAAVQDYAEKKAHTSCPPFDTHSPISTTMAALTPSSSYGHQRG
jgi:hypothetical protein